MSARDWIRRVALGAGYRVTALPPNRFEAQVHG